MNNTQITELHHELIKVRRTIRGLTHDIDRGDFEPFSIYWKKIDLKSMIEIKDEIEKDISAINA